MEKLLFTELRVLRGQTEGTKSVTKENLELALIDNENLKALGYVLKGEGIVQLAKDYQVNPGITPIHAKVKEFEPDISASPMYPNFPIQVLEMSEMDFRINQVLHYLSTYGVELILGAEVQKGWLPTTSEEMQRKEDEQVAKLKTLDYLAPSEVSTVALVKMLGRKERLLPNQLTIVLQLMQDKNREPIMEIPFKENIGLVFADVLLDGTLEERQAALAELSGILKHPGDVMDLVEYLVIKNKYKHFKTSLKRGLVELIEKFSLGAIEENLASHRWSKAFLGKGGKKRALNRNVALVDYLSYSKFTKNAEAMAIVNELKDGKLFSWNQLLEKAYAEGNMEEVLRLLNQRPGIYFRQINRLYKNGVPFATLSADAKRHAIGLKTQSIISTLNNFKGEQDVRKVFFDALVGNLMGKEVEQLKGKKVYIDESEVSFDHSKLAITDKFEDGGYIQSGMAIKLPENAEFVRFFTYWNDERRIDIDLHASYEKSTEYGDQRGHVGWNGNAVSDGLVHSGDITHSDAAEYVDIDLAKAKEAGVKRVQFNINSFTQVPFSDIETIFTGIMLLSQFGQEVKLYDQKNVVFRHDLNSKAMATNYGLIDLEKGLLRIIGENGDRYNDVDLEESTENHLTISTYLEILLAAQGAKIVSDKEQADVVLGLTKADEENYISLIDENFFM